MNCINDNDSLVYLNKVFFNQSQASCPIISTLTTTTDTFTQKLTITSPSAIGNGCNCCCDGCNDFTVTENTIFNVTKAKVRVSSFNLSEASEIDPTGITIDGNAVASLTRIDGRYIADLSSIMDEIITCCPREHFFLAQVPGPWIFFGSIEVEGTVSSGGTTCCFSLCVETIPTEAGYEVTGADNFAIYNLEIPCRAGGISPVASFSFDGCGSLLNPVITAATTGDVTTLTLSGTLIFTPEINLSITRETLFNVDYPEVPIPCDSKPCSLCDTPICCCDKPAIAVPSTEGCQTNDCQTNDYQSNDFQKDNPPCQCCNTQPYSF